ncbi:MAG: hypothetical protein HY074_12850 [Deltaproteobacteria bacterium]|nr:hypothetical protein [Deltaproteobacteria bacterium]
MSARAELKEFYRGTRAMGMGGAYTSLADDADSVFYNPAGLALNPAYEFRLFNPKIDISTDDIAILSDIRAAASKIDGPTLSKLFGKHVYADANIMPTIFFPGLAVGYYYDVQTHIVSRNLSFPSIQASYLKDNGVVAGFGHEFGGFAKHHYLRFGMGVKWLTREGFAQTIPLTSLVTADKTYLAKLNSAKASGWGATLGMQYDMPINRSNDLILGSAWQDIGDTSFGNDLQSQRPPPIRNNLSAGLALVHRFSPGYRSTNNLKITGELRHLAEGGIDPRLRVHAGAELQIGIVSIQGGINQDSLTAGAKISWLFFDVSAVTYGVEDQSLAFMDRERRYMLQATLRFDIMGRGLRPDRDEDRRKHPRQY